jgi:CRISPR-associated protein Cas6
MYWQDPESREQEFQVPDDVVDLVFRLRGKSIDIDHAYSLSRALQERLGSELCARIGVHGIRLAGSGNGWQAPAGADAEIPLPRRARLAIRLRREDCEAVAEMSNRRLDMGAQSIEVGECTVRKLSSLDTLHARAVCCRPDQSEEEFLQQAAAELETMGIAVSRMLCGMSGSVRTADGELFTRALLVADLKPAQSVTLQQRGIGGERLLGAVHEPRE